MRPLLFMTNLKKGTFRAFLPNNYPNPNPNPNPKAVITHQGTRHHDLSMRVEDLVMKVKNYR